MFSGPRRINHSKLFLVAGLAAIASAIFFLTQEKKINESKQPAVAHSRKQLISSSHDQSLRKFSLTGFDEQGKKFWNLEGDTARIDPGQMVYLDQNVTLKLKENTIDRK